MNERNFVYDIFNLIALQMADHVPLYTVSPVLCIFIDKFLHIIFAENMFLAAMHSSIMERGFVLLTETSVISSGVRPHRAHAA